VDTWWSGGGGPILVLHALEDPISEVGNARGLADEYPERVTFVQLAHASHAMLPEQPAALAAALAAYLGGERDAQRLQALIDANVVTPQ
jgi:pimeloyl-ACP methyl ester carboxylesterase